MRLLYAGMLVTLLLPALGATSAQHLQTTNARPDIVLVLTDDMTEADWRSLPKTKARLPAIFPNYINVDPLCCPSRASILRGQYPHSHGTWSNENGPRGGRESFRDQEDATIAVELQQAGYRTGYSGKYLNGYLSDGGVPPGWSSWFAQVDTKDQYFDWRAVVDGTTVRSYGHDEDDYSTDVIARKAVDFVKGTPRDKPLFAYVAPYAPHGPATVAPRHRGDCEKERLGSRGKPSLNEKGMADKPGYMQHQELDLAELTGFDRKRQCSLKAVDQLVVALVAALETRGRPYDLVFATDNGYLLGEHRRTGKGVPYEESIRTTMRAVGPDFPAGTDARLVGNIDLAPTFAAIAGAAPRADWDGRSLLAGAEPRLDRQLIAIESSWEAGSDDTISSTRVGGPFEPTPPYRGFRTKDRTVYVEYETGEVELYDLAADPYQLANLAKGKTSADFPVEHTRLQVLRDCHAQACWAAEDEPLAPGKAA